MGSSEKNKSKPGRPLDGLTPAMRQYVEQKQRVGDAILLFRMGDFYETFYDDAVLCSKVLGIALTSRDKSTNPIPLAGIPYHALDKYLSKLVRAGHKVAISEQLEDAKQAKGVVKRDVVRIVTAGTLTDEALLDERDDNVLAAVCIRRDEVGLAQVELAGGRFEVIDTDKSGLLDELVRLRPAEILVDDELKSPAAEFATELHTICGTAVTRRPLHEFSDYQAERSLLDHFGVSTLAGFGFDGMNPPLCAAGAIIGYLTETQQSALGHIPAVARRAPSDHVQIDHSSWRALEVDRTLREGLREGTLLFAVDRTVHPIGSRKLRHWLCAPLRQRDELIRRQDAVALLVDSDGTREQVRKKLRAMADVERIAARVALARCSPRDLRALGVTLEAAPDLAKAVRGSGISLLGQIADDMEGMDELCDLLGRSIAEEPPLSLREGGFIAGGFDEELDRLRGLGRDGHQWLADFQQREAKRSGIASLKVGFNRVFGYYIEVSKSVGTEVPPDYVRRQTVKNAERYITDELKKFEAEVLTAQEQANQREYELFEQVREQVAAEVPGLMRIAGAIGRLDCLAGLAEVAVQRRYVRPELMSDGFGLEIKDGRHPVLDQTLGDGFVPNDAEMSGPDHRVFVITGPNMAGKSTYIRQVALLTLLAQTGSFVPAGGMKFSLVDRIFARVGAFDEIARGQSTFMVEMTEAANICHHATERSLVVLDELGRGTSTFDGLSLAWAITEHLANEVRCRALVATHYHELTGLAELLQGVSNYNVAVREVPGAEKGEEGIAFLHRIVPGGASKSYGIHVAKLAGVPRTVVARSLEILQELEAGFSRESRTPMMTRAKTRDDPQLLLFRDPAEELTEALAGIDPDETTPLEALKLLLEWKEKMAGAGDAPKRA